MASSTSINKWGNWLLRERADALHESKFFKILYTSKPTEAFRVPAASQYRAAIPGKIL